MAKINRRRDRHGARARLETEAGVAFLDDTCTRTDWVRAERDGADDIIETLTDFLRVRPHLLDPSVPPPSDLSCDADVIRRSVRSIGRRCLQLCRGYGLGKDDVARAYWLAMEEYRAVASIVMEKGEGISIGKLEDPRTGFVLYDSRTMRRGPIDYRPDLWVLTGIKEGRYRARRMPGGVNSDDVDRESMVLERVPWAGEGESHG